MPSTSSGLAAGGDTRAPMWFFRMAAPLFASGRCIMNESEPLVTSRRDFLKTTGKAAAVSALAGVSIPHVHAAGSDTIQIALVGCGGRGGGAAGNALEAKGQQKLVAMADVFEDRLDTAYSSLKKAHASKVDVSDDRKFIGFDGYKKALDCLKPGDIAI